MTTTSNPAQIRAAFKADDSTQRILLATQQLQPQIKDGWWLYASPRVAVAVDHSTLHADLSQLPVQIESHHLLGDLLATLEMLHVLLETVTSRVNDALKMQSTTPQNPQ